MATKTVVEELAEANERVKALEASQAAGVKALEGMTAERDQAKAGEKAALDLATKAEADKAEAVKALEAERTEKAQAIADRDAAKAETAKVLANPAFAAAAKQGLKAGTDEGGQAHRAQFATRADAETAYRKIEGAKERAAFRAEHKEILGL